MSMAKTMLTLVSNVQCIRHLLLVSKLSKEGVIQGNLCVNKAIILSKKDCEAG